MQKLLKDVQILHGRIAEPLTTQTFMALPIRRLLLQIPGSGWRRSCNRKS